jgi:hypothetical protein
MADDTQGAPQQSFLQSSSPQLPPMLPTQNVSQLSIAVNQQEFLICCGHMRVLMGLDQKTGLPTSVTVPEWLLTLSLSPTTAEILKRSLEQGISEFEKNFGKIPVPKTARPTVSTHEDKPTSKA